MLATGRAKINDGTLIISSVLMTDSGSLFCTAMNSEGQEHLKVELSVTSPLTASIQPFVQTISIGQPTDLVSKVVFIYGFKLYFVTYSYLTAFAFSSVVRLDIQKKVFFGLKTAKDCVRAHEYVSYQMNTFIFHLLLKKIRECINALLKTNLNQFRHLLN